MINDISHIYSKSILEKPKKILFILLSLLVLSSFYMSDFELDASADTLILENDKDLRIYRESLHRYQTKDFLIMTFTPHDGDIFDEKNLNLISKLKEKLLKIDGVESITSLIDVPLVKSSNKPLTEMIADVPTIFSESVDINKAREEILNSPIYKNLIISDDAKTTAMQINLKSNQKLINLVNEKSILIAKQHDGTLTNTEKVELINIEKHYTKLKKDNDNFVHNLLAKIRLERDAFEKNNVKLRLGGIPMIADDMITYVKNDLTNFGIGVFIFIIITLTIIFRQIKWIVLPLLSCIYSVAIMLGFLGMMEWKVTVISSNFISLMLILTLSMNIHMIVRYRQISVELKDNQLNTVKLMTSKMVRPCLYTALTTIVAFLSLVFSDIKPVIDFGYMMVLGLVVLFLTSFLLLPSILCLLEKDSDTYQVTNKTFFLTNFLAKQTIENGKSITAITFFILILTIYGVFQLKVENSFINYFKSDTEIYQGMKQIDDKLGGTTPLDVIIKFDDESQINFEQEDDEFGDLLDETDGLLDETEKDLSANWFTTSKINQIKSIHDYLDSLPEVGKVLSLASTIRVAEELNDNQELTSLEMSLLYKRAPEEVKKVAVHPYISIENNEARINLRILDSKKDLRRKEFIDKVRFDLINKLNLNEDKFIITGILVLYNNMLQSLFDSQILSLGFVMLGIAIMFMVLFKSSVLSFIGIIPNLIAAVFVLGLMGLMKLPLDMMTITIAAITIGIAVDNSIHYIYRFREEFRKTNNYEQTVYLCHDTIGRAIFFTGITIIFGFSILILSNFIPTIIFGLLTGLAMFVALLAVLTLLPRLIILIRPF